MHHTESSDLGPDMDTIQERYHHCHHYCCWFPEAVITPPPTLPGRPKRQPEVGKTGNPVNRENPILRTNPELPPGGSLHPSVLKSPHAPRAAFQARCVLFRVGNNRFVELGRPGADQCRPATCPLAPTWISWKEARRPSEKVPFKDSGPSRARIPAPA